MNKEVVILYNYEDYHILSMETYCIIKDKKHIITTIVNYVKNKKPYRKVFKNILENKGDEDE